jgi:hypothetical protein
MSTSGKRVMQCDRINFWTEFVWFPQTIIVTVKGIYSLRAGQLHSLESVTVEWTVLTLESLTAVKVLFYPILSDSRKSIAFWKVTWLKIFTFLLRAASI